MTIGLSISGFGLQNVHLNITIGRVIKASASGAVDLGLILKLVFVASLLDAQH